MTERIESLSEMNLEEIRSLAEAEGMRVATLGQWPDWKMDPENVKSSLAGRIPHDGDTKAQGFDAGLACALDMIPRQRQLLSAKLHGNYTPEAVAQVIEEMKDLNPDSESAWWLAASGLCNEGAIDPPKFREQLRKFEELSADPKARLNAAKAEHEKMVSSFNTNQFDFPFGPADGAIQGAYLAGYPAGAYYSQEHGIYFIGTNLPSLGLDNFEWSKELDEKGYAKSGPLHGSQQFVKCANEAELKRAIQVVKNHLKMES